MESVDVAIEAMDAFSTAGLASQLRSRREVRVVAREELTGRGVFLVAVDKVSSREIAYLRGFGTKPLVPKVLVTDATIETDPRAVLDCGVVSLLTRADATADRLVASVLTAAKERNAKAALDALAERMRPERSSRGRTTNGLTSREVDVLKLMADGLDTIDIATRLCYSERTVKNVIYALTSRLKLRSRPHAVAYAMRAGLI